MATLVGLSLKIAANTAGIAQGAKDTAKAMEGIKASADSAAGSLKLLAGIEVGKLLAGAFTSATSAISGFVSNIRTTVDETAKLARRTGIAVESLQGFQVAAGLSGVQNLEGAVQKLTIRIGEAANGTKTAQDAFSRLGLSYEELAGLAPDDQFRAIASAINELPSNAERAAAAVQVFGKSGVELLPLFESNLSDIEKRANSLGIVLSGQQTQAIEDMNDALSLVYQTFEGIIGQVTANLAPVVTAISEEFLSFVEAFQGVGGTGGSGIAKALTDGLFEFLEYFATLFDGVIESFGSFGDVMSAVSGVFEFTANTFAAVAGILKTVFNVFEMVGNALMLGLGKVLEGLGSWVSSDLEAAGRALAESSFGELKKNAGEAGDAFVGSVNAVLGDRNFGRNDGDGGGYLSGILAGAKERFQNAGQGGENPVQEENARKTTGIKKWVQDLARNAEEAERIEKQRLDKISGLNKQYSENAQDIEANRLDALSRQNQEALQVNDIRSGGISQFLALATGREDPAVAEARAQRKELEKIAAEIRKLGGTVELVGAA